MHDYAIYYTVIKNNLYILSFWDNRQDPERLEL
ncbi:hypothetical protein SAMN05216365_10324 [Porphyromonadaceae bacterium NLAE-zl-C104]|nr:hypothetical protein SAMN05216331_13624 [Porphyromonadaceae bacterium KH3R12]SFK79241.1 hypothetical protein SAMN05216357_10657 [Porphyromonadaceae bacterium KH3CP3RA]SFS35010.1 hypothetical protein SAMN05216365_10324 [Porphyromonadaceae bacterium NLAE-zl-C104]